MQMGILGGLPGARGQGKRGILGGYNPIRQIAEQQGAPMAASGWGAMPDMSGGMGAGPAPDGPPAYGSDEWAMQGGPGAMIWRELARAGVYNAIDPKKAGDVFSDQSRAILGGDYAKRTKRKDR